MPPSQSWIIEANPVVNPVQPQLPLFFLAVVLVLMIRLALLLYSDEVVTKRRVLILLYGNGGLVLDSQVVEVYINVALVGDQHLYVTIHTGRQVGQHQLLPIVLI